MNPSSDHIDKFLRNELTAEEHQRFETAMAEDPALKEQVTFDQSVAEGLKRYRKAELKARLDAVDVSSPWFGQVGNGALMKTVGTLVTVGVIGLSAYLYISDTDPIQSGNSLDINNIDHPQKEVAEDLTFPDIATTLETSEPESSVETLASDEINGKLLTEAKAESKPKMAQREEKEEFYPSVDVPVLGDITESSTLETSEVEVPTAIGAGKVEELQSNVIDVRIRKNKKSDQLGYKYFDGKLFLYGKFDRSPYEILEINKATEKNIYLYYDEQFYNITPTDDVEQLNPITSESVLGELKIIRNNKQ